MTGSVSKILGTVILAASLVCVAASGRGQSATDQRADSGEADSTLYKWSAGTLRFREEEGKQVVYLRDNVRIDHQTATITSLNGKHYLDEERFTLRDDVHAVDGTMHIYGDIGEYFGRSNLLMIKENVRAVDVGMEVTCDWARYDRDSREALLVGNVRLADSTRILYADTVNYHRNTELAEAFGRVLLIDLVEDFAISGRTGRYYRNQGKAVVDAEPVLTFDQSKEEPGRIKSELMMFDMNENVGNATGEVRMRKGETSAECDSAVIHNGEGYVEMLGNPSASSGPSNMRGSRINLWYDARQVTRIVLPEYGYLSEAPPKGSRWWKDSWIEGDSVVIHLYDENVDSVKIFGNARAKYYPNESEKGKVSNNYSTGDSMFFRFDGNELDYVRVSGRTSGLYKYLHIADDQTIDSLAAATDTLLEYRDFDEEAQRISYQATNIEYFARTEDISLDRNASLNYQNKTLVADHIDFSSKLNILKAEGNPVLEENEQKIYGEDMGYDMDRGGGLVTEGSTQYESGYYLGEHIFKDGEDILKVYNSTYTTCDLAHPHYSLRANRMKVYIGDKVVSGPIRLYIGEMPVFYLPFLANSLRKDRHSGILRPNFDIGINSREGRFIRGLGYYWATNDYTDFKVTTDFNERRNLRIRLDNRYNVRYMLNGNAAFDFLRDFRNKSSEWTVNSTHNQTFGKSASFRSNLRFVSSDKAQSALHQAKDVKQVVDRRIYSRASFNKSWGGTRLGLSATRDQKLNIDPDNPTEVRISTTMPSFSLNFPRTSLWFGEKHEGDARSMWERALRSIAFSPNLSGRRTTTESNARSGSMLTASSGASFSQQHKLLFLNLSPSLSMRWNYSRVLKDEIDSDYQGTLRPIGSNESRFSMSLNSGVGTTLYGTFYPNLGPVRGIRHTFNPTASFSYRPKLQEGQIEDRSVSYSVRNILDLKVLEGGEVVKKNNVLTWNLSGSYDPDAEKGSRFSNISSSVRTSIGRLISVSMNQTYDPREKEIISTSFSADMSLNGIFSYPAEWRRVEKKKVAAARGRSEDKEEKDGDEGKREERRWSLSLGYSYSARGSGAFSSVSSKVDMRGTISLTRGWNISYSGYYDLERGQFTNQQYSLERDLHCWQASFIHRRFGGEWSYYFQIAIKELPDIMYERGKRGLQSSVPFLY